MAWLKDCEICNVGLCNAVNARKEKGLSERAACREMSEESEGLYSENAILNRYRYHTGKKKVCQSDTEPDEIDEEKEDEIIRTAMAIKKKRFKAKKELRQKKQQELYDYWDSLPAREGSPAEREKQAFYKKENDIYHVCLALAPDEDHPYMETADFEISREDYEGIPKDLKPAEAFDIIFQLHNEKRIVCTKTGTWGDYGHPKSDLGCNNHFIHYSNGKKPDWWKSGIEHGLPIKAFKTDMRILQPYEPTPEEKAQKEINYCTKNIEKHYKKIEKLGKRLVRLEKEGGRLSSKQLQRIHNT